MRCPPVDERFTAVTSKGCGPADDVARVEELKQALESTTNHAAQHRVIYRLDPLPNSRLGRELALARNEGYDDDDLTDVLSVPASLLLTAEGHLDSMVPLLDTKAHVSLVVLARAALEACRESSGS